MYTYIYIHNIYIYIYILCIYIIYIYIYIKIYTSIYNNYMTIQHTYNMYKIPCGGWAASPRPGCDCAYLHTFVHIHWIAWEDIVQDGCLKFVYRLSPPPVPASLCQACLTFNYVNSLVWVTLCLHTLPPLTPI